jgi:hypothetical protein
LGSRIAISEELLVSSFAQTDTLAKLFKAGALTLGAMIVSFAANGETFVTSFLAMLLGAGLIFASQTLWP